MPIYEYQGQQYEMQEADPVKAKERILNYLGTQTPKVPEKEDVSLLDSAKTGFMSGANRATGALYAAGAGINSMLGNDYDAEKFIELKKQQDKYWQENTKHSKDLSNKLVEGISQLPYYMSGGLAGLQAVGTGVDSAENTINAGGSTSDALLSGAISTGLTTGAVALPPAIGTGALMGAATGAGMNAGQTALDPYLQNKLIREPNKLEQVPYPEINDLLSAGLLGGAFGAIHNAGKPVAKKPNVGDAPPSVPKDSALSPELKADIDQRISTLSREIAVKTEKFNKLSDDEVVRPVKEQLDNEIRTMEQQRDVLLSVAYPKEYRLDPEKAPEEVNATEEQIPLSAYDKERMAGREEGYDFTPARDVETVRARFNEQEWPADNPDKLLSSIQSRFARLEVLQKSLDQTTEGTTRNKALSKAVDLVTEELRIQMELANSRGLDYSQFNRHEGLNDVEVAMKLDKGDYRGALEQVRIGSKSPALRKLSEKLLSNPNVAKFAKITFDGALKGHAAYQALTNEFFFRNFSSATGLNVVHEAIHSATSGALDAFARGMNVPLHMHGPLNGILRVYDVLQNHIGQMKSMISEPALVDAMMKNPKELIAYGLTDMRLRKVLSQMQAGKQSFLQRLMNNISRLWGGGKEMESALTHLERDTNDLIDSATGKAIDASKDIDYSNQDIDVGWSETGSPIADALKRIPLNAAKWGFTATIPQFWRTHPVIQGVSKIVNSAERRASANFHAVFGGEARNLLKTGRKVFFKLSKVQEADGLGAALLKSNYEEIANAFDVLKIGYSNRINDVEQLIQQHGQHLNENELATLRGIDRASKKQLEIINESLNSRGLKGIASKDGYFPVTRIGKHLVQVSVNGVPLRIESFISEKEAKNFIKKFSKDNPQAEVVSVQKDTSTQNLIDIMETVRNSLLQSEADRSPDQINRIINAHIEGMGSNANSVGGHNLYRPGLEGYVGSELGLTQAQRGKRIAIAMEQWVKETNDSLRKREIAFDIIKERYSVDKKTGLVTDKWETTPNARDIAQHLVDIHTNQMKPVLEQAWDGIRETFDAAFVTAFPNKKLNTHVLDRASGLLSHLFYAQTLTMRPSIWISQYLSTVNSFRSLFKDENSSIFKASSSLGETLIKLSTGEMAKDQGFIDGLNYMVQKTNDLHPQLTNELNSLAVTRDPNGRANKLVKLLSGETFSAAGDTTSRYLTWALFYNHFKKDGLKGQELWDKAADAVNQNQFQYGKRWQPAMYQKLGLMGEQMSPLKTFAHGQLGNLIADVKDLIQKPDAKSIAALSMSGLSLSLLGGLISAPLVAEYELLRMLGIKLGWWGDEWPSLTKMMLEKPDWISHGVLSSATGMDIGASMRYNSLIQGLVDGQQSALAIFPALNFAWDYTKAAGTKLKEFTTHSVTPEDEYTATKTMAPKGPVWGMVDQFKYNSTSRDYVPDSKGRAVVPQTNKEVIASYMGSQSLEESKDKKIAFEQKTSDTIRTNQKKYAISMLLSGDDRKMQIGIEKLVQLGVPPDQIKSMLVSTQQQKVTPILERFYLNKKGKVGSYDQARKLSEMYDMMREDK